MADQQWWTDEDRDEAAAALWTSCPDCGGSGMVLDIAASARNGQPEPMQCERCAYLNAGLNPTPGDVSRVVEAQLAALAPTIDRIRRQSMAQALREFAELTRGPSKDLRDVGTCLSIALDADERADALDSRCVADGCERDLHSFVKVDGSRIVHFEEWVTATTQEHGDIVTQRRVVMETPGGRVIERDEGAPALTQLEQLLDAGVLDSGKAIRGGILYPVAVPEASRSLTCPDCGNYRDTPGHEFGCRGDDPAPEPNPCGHPERVKGCGGCDPGAIEFVRDDDGPSWRPYDPATDIAHHHESEY